MIRSNASGGFCLSIIELKGIGPDSVMNTASIDQFRTVDVGNGGNTALN